MGRGVQYSILILILVSLLSCDLDKVTSPVPAERFLVDAPAIVKVGDSVRIRLNLDHPMHDKMTSSWSTNFGKIRATDNEIIFYAPELPGRAMLSVTAEASDANGESASRYADSVKIDVYRQLIFLKADDMVYDPETVVSPRWQKFIDYISERHLKAGIGIVGSSLEKGNYHYFNYVRKLALSGSFEIWNHGYTHTLNERDENGKIYHEFWNRPVDYQLEHLEKTQELAKDKLGITLHSFGAPGNACDVNTIIALGRVEELKIWYYGPENSGKMVVERTTEIEYPVLHPKFESFLKNYRSEHEYISLQVHPNAWDNSQFTEFEQMVEFLISQGATFSTPWDYYRMPRKQ
jgi:peptidoglycan/xylan/chitin deacetylase (PgdA/CDA1 family)